jgi:hypothetical protein
MSVLYPRLFVVATDSIAVSMSVARMYLSARGIGPNWVQPRDNLHRGPYDLAINVHSWSECTLDEVAEWLDWLVSVECRRLFIVPHDTTFRTWTEEGSCTGPSYLPLLSERKYRLAQEWIGPECKPKMYSLFERMV